MPMQPVNISDTGYQMFLDDESVFAPRERGLERQAKQNALARQTAVRNALAQSINPATGQMNWQFARQMGGVDVAPELRAAQQADMMAQAELDHKRGLGLEANLKAKGEYWKQQRDVAARLNDQASWSTWRSTLPAEFQPIVPEQFSQDNKRKTIATADDLLKTHFQQVDTGGGGYTLQMPEIGGGPATEVPGSRYTTTISPSEQSRVDREFNPNKVAHVTTDEQGNNHFFNNQGVEISVGAGQGTGKPSAAVTTGRIKSEQLRKDLQSTVGELERIVKPGGLLDVSTGSGAGALVDRAAEFVGSSTEGAQAISRLKPIADMVLKLVPRFEGPQSDADTKSYRDAAGDLANPSLPREQRKAAAQTILRLFKQRQGQFGTPDADGNVVTSGAAPSTSGGSDIDALVERHRSK